MKHANFSWMFVLAVAGAAFGTIYIGLGGLGPNLLPEQQLAQVFQALNGQNETIVTFSSEGGEAFNILTNPGNISPVSGQAVVVSRENKKWGTLNGLFGTMWIGYSPDNYKLNGGPKQGTMVRFSEHVNVVNAQMALIAMLADDTAAVRINGTEVLAAASAKFKGCDNKGVNCQRPVVFSVDGGLFRNGDNLIEFDVYKKQKPVIVQVPSGTGAKTVKKEDSRFGISYAGLVVSKIQIPDVGGGDTSCGQELCISGGMFGQVTGRVGTLTDEVGQLTFTTGPTGQAILNQITLTFKGPVIAPGATAFSVELADAVTNSILPGTSQKICSPGSAGSCTVTFTPNYAVAPATTKGAKVRINSSGFLGGELAVSAEAGAIVYSAASGSNLTNSSWVSIATVSYVGGQTGSLSVVKNSAFADPIYSVGTSQARIASFVVSAGQTEGLKISSLSFDKDNNPDLDLQNLLVKVNAAQFGNIRATIGDSETSLVFSSANPVSVPQNGSVVVDVYADILTSSFPKGYNSAIDLIGWSALGAISNSAITIPSMPDGQGIIVASGSLTVNGAVIGATSNRFRQGQDEVVNAYFTNNGASNIFLKKASFTLSGTTLSNGSSLVVDLIDSNTGFSFGSSAQQSCAPSASQCVVTFNPNYTISAYSTVNPKVRINSSSFYDTTGSETLSISVVNTGDVQYDEGTKIGINITPVPITIASVSYQ